MHSRANCANNETISWDWLHDWLLYTESNHYYKGEFKHNIITPAAMTWRSASVCWGEGRGGWMVDGVHWRHYTDGRWYMEQREKVTDCSIYDGWWDKNK